LSIACCSLLEENSSRATKFRPDGIATKEGLGAAVPIVRRWFQLASRRSLQLIGPT
jgi:hypothetical protein